jgi:hypothetical protein
MGTGTNKVEAMLQIGHCGVKARGQLPSRRGERFGHLGKCLTFDIGQHPPHSASVARTQIHGQLIIARSDQKGCTELLADKVSRHRFDVVMNRNSEQRIDPLQHRAKRLLWEQESRRERCR